MRLKHSGYLLLLLIPVGIMLRLQRIHKVLSDIIEVMLLNFIFFSLQQKTI